MRCFAIAGLLLTTPAAAAAEVVSSSANSFHIQQSFTVSAPPAAAFAAFGQVQKWWSASHTYSGDPKRLSLQLRPGGCFCERLASGGVEHLRVTYVDAPERIVLTGALGPLLYQAVTGVMDVRIQPAGAGSQVSMNYKAVGFASGGADKLAPAVDGVLTEQMKGFATFAGR